MRDFIIQLVRSAGAWGVGVLMFIENVFPPIPSELIMPLAGFLASQGDIAFWLAVGLGSLGSLMGAILWYLVGRWLGKDRMKAWAGRHGSWVAMTPDDLDRAKDWFDRHGGISVLLGRMVPFIRTAISVPAGMTEMRFLSFLIYSAIGTVIWTGALAWAGRLLGSQFPQVGSVLGWVTWAVIGLAFVWYIYRVVEVHRKNKMSAGTG